MITYDLKCNIVFTAGAQNTRRPFNDEQNIIRIHIIIIIIVILLLYTNLLQVNMRNTLATWNYNIIRIHRSY